MKLINLNYNYINLIYNYKNTLNMLIMKVDIEICIKNMKELIIH